MANLYAVYHIATRELISVSEEILSDDELVKRNFGKVILLNPPAWDGEVWDPPTLAFKPRAADFITPIVTRAQASGVLKNLFETTPAAWTAAQEKQALYAILYLLFRDFRNGTV